MAHPLCTLALAGSLAAASPTLAADLARPTPEERVVIGDAIAGIGLHADQHEWDRLEAGFAPEVTTDHASLFGGAPQTQARAAPIAGWRGMLPGFDATQHRCTG